MKFSALYAAEEVHGEDGPASCPGHGEFKLNYKVRSLEVCVASRRKTTQFLACLPLEATFLCGSLYSRMCLYPVLWAEFLVDENAFIIDLLYLHVSCAVVRVDGS